MRILPRKRIESPERILPDKRSYYDDFESYSIGSDGSPNWTPIESEGIKAFLVEEGGVGKIYKSQLGLGGGPKGIRRALFNNNQNLDDVKVTMKTKAYWTGEGNIYVGTLIRNEDALFGTFGKNGYSFRTFFRTTSSTVEIYKILNDETRLLLGQAVTLGVHCNEWFEMVCEAKGSQLKMETIFASETLTLIVIDSSYTVGEMAIFTSVTWGDIARTMEVDDIRIQEI